MFQKIVNKFSKSNNKKKHASHTVRYSKAEHGIQRNQISSHAQKIIQHLESNGYEAYLVGGAVRDLLLDIKPKDFDIATNAEPEEIKAIFNNCRLIGRRFRLAHIYYGREVIEVATFRASHDTKKSHHDKSKHARTSDEGQLTRDNVFGTVEEDALRRDISINSLYYALESEEVLDFADGVEDIKRRNIRLIGDPLQRYQEDPVRILRAIRFAAKLGFEIDKDSALAITEANQLLLNVPGARLFDEVIKLFHNPEAIKTFQLLRHYGVYQYLLPQSHHSAESYIWSDKLFELALENTVDRIKQEKPVTIAFLYAVLLWPAFKEKIDSIDMKRPNFERINEEAQKVLKEQSQVITIPKRFAFAIKDIWSYQYRLPKRNGKSADWLLGQRRFRAAFDFLLLREACGEIKPGLGDWWQNYQFADEETQTKMKAQVGARRSPKTKQQRKKQDQ